MLFFKETSIRRASRRVENLAVSQRSEGGVVRLIMGENEIVEKMCTKGKLPRLLAGLRESRHLGWGVAW